jgi:uracil-DNA glycosylase
MKHKIIFVGDKPSSKNLNKDTPFIGTPSHANLLKWIDSLLIEDYVLLNSHTDKDKLDIINLPINNLKWVALGNNSSKVLQLLKINHFKLPHPSPRNRLLNDKNYIDSELIKCKNYIS